MFRLFQISATAFALSLGLSLSPVYAQDDTENVNELAKIVEDIAASRQATLDKIDAISSGIDLSTTSLNEADKAFDEMIETLKAQAAVGDPSGSFVTRLEALEKAAQADAEAAKLAGYLDFEKAFLEDADVFDKQKAVMSAEFDALDRRIRTVESERERITFLIKLKRYDDLQALFDEATGVIRDGSDRLGQVEEALRKTDPNLVQN